MLGQFGGVGGSIVSGLCAYTHRACLLEDRLTRQYPHSAQWSIESVRLDATRKYCSSSVDGLASMSERTTSLTFSQPTRLVSTMLNLDQVRPVCGQTYTACANVAQLQEVTLWTSNADREKFENLATLYAIIISLDHLERAYVRDTIRSDAYVSELSMSKEPC